jgi:hypothetical protein
VIQAVFGPCVMQGLSPVPVQCNFIPGKGADADHHCRGVPSPGGNERAGQRALNIEVASNCCLLVLLALHAACRLSWVLMCHAPVDRSSGGYTSGGYSSSAGGYASDRGCGYASCSSDGEGLSSEAKSMKRRKFEQHRKQHYNMKEALQKCAHAMCCSAVLELRIRAGLRLDSCAAEGRSC